MDYSLERRKSLVLKRPPPPAEVAPSPKPPARVLSSASAPKTEKPAREAPAETKTEVRPTKTSKKNADGEREYTAEEINQLTAEGYIIVHPGLWDHIAAGSHIRYVKKDIAGEGKSRGKRFKPGGFVKNHYMDDSGRKVFTLESRLKNNSKTEPPGYIMYSVPYDNIETIWKKYDKLSFIEIYLIHNSLAQKKQQIESLLSRVEQLEATVARLSSK